MRACERAAYGVMALKPWEFWSLTPRDFELLCAGAMWREERAWDRAVAGTVDKPSAALGRDLHASRVPGYMTAKRGR